MLINFLSFEGNSKIAAVEVEPSFICEIPYELARLLGKKNEIITIPKKEIFIYALICINYPQVPGPGY